MAAPHRFVGQEVLHLSSAPTSEQDRLVRRSLVLRSFAVRSGDSYTAMLGGLARVINENRRRRGPLVTDPDGGLAKDVWVVGQRPGRRRPDRRRRAGGRPSELVLASPSSAHLGDGAAGAERPVLVRPVRRAGRGPAPAGPGRPHGGRRDRLRHHPRSGAGGPAAGGHPRQHHVPGLPRSPASRSCRSSARCCSTGTGRARRRSPSAPCRWPRRAYAISCPRTSGWCWPTSSGPWRRWPPTRTTRVCS